jgi:hypothetical protein
MKELSNQWFEQSSPFQGILACGIRHPDQSAISKVWSDGFTEMAVENAMRCIADFFQIVQLNRIPPGRVRWSYEKAFVYCERRADGTCLSFFTLRDPAAVDLDGLERMFGEFQGLSQATSR